MDNYLYQIVLSWLPFESSFVFCQGAMMGESGKTYIFATVVNCDEICIFKLLKVLLTIDGVNQLGGGTPR